MGGRLVTRPPYTRFILCALCAAALAACVRTPDYKRVDPGDVGVVLKVVDEHGEPVFCASVWRVATPRLEKLYYDEVKPQLSLGYVDRISRRYQYFPEFVNTYGPGEGAIPWWNSDSSSVLTVLTPTDKAGATRDVLKVQVQRPKIIRIRYAALKYGYIPGKVELEARAGERFMHAKIVLRRNPAVHPVDAPYIRTFDSVRYRSSLSGSGGPNDMAPYRKELIKAAEQAEAAGDRKSAARMYSWVPFIRTLRYSSDTSGRYAIYGYRALTERDAPNMAMLRKAAALDPSNRYVQMKLLLLDPPHRLEARAKALEHLIAGGTDDLWPRVFLHLEETYYQLGEKRKAHHWFVWFHNREPDDLANQTDRYKERLARYVSLDEFRQRFLIGGDVNKKDEFLAPPIYYAVRAGRVDLYDWLLAHGVKKPLPSYMINQSIDSQNPAMLRRLLNTGPAVTGITTDPHAYDNLESVLADITGVRKMTWSDVSALDEMERIARRYWKEHKWHGGT